MICPQCQRENLSDAIFCDHCGMRFETVCSHCGRTEPSGSHVLQNLRSNNKSDRNNRTCQEIPEFPRQTATFPDTSPKRYWPRGSPWKENGNRSPFSLQTSEDRQACGGARSRRGAEANRSGAAGHDGRGASIRRNCESGVRGRHHGAFRRTVSARRSRVARLLCSTGHAGRDAAISSEDSASPKNRDYKSALE